LEAEIKPKKNRAGFTKIPNFVFQFETTPSEFKVLAVLYFHLPNIYPSSERIAQLTNLSTRQISRALTSLQKKGLIMREFRVGMTTKYRVRLTNSFGG
jgi:DNA-binding MarR family transcriptional regulator